MLTSLHIKNFKNLKDFKINSLERVNLITGKNNTGKSSILEALALYESKGDIGLLTSLLENRGEPNKARIVTDRKETLKAFSSIYTNRYFDDTIIRIGVAGDTLKDVLTLEIKNYKDEYYTNESGDEVHKRIFVNDNKYNIGLKINFNESSDLIKINRPFERIKSTFSQEDKKGIFQFINPRDIDKEQNSLLWDNIILTDKEEAVIKGLKIIEPNVERIAFIEEGNWNGRFPVIKVKGEKQVLPLKSMGDGINRILTIILALVNAEGGMLLIDEFENGLHHTVQEQLWKMIFLLAEELDIQVFATTHSEDCIRGFENVLNDYDIETNGKLIRLDKKGDEIVQVEFDKEELKVATDFGIEIR